LTKKRKETGKDHPSERREGKSLAAFNEIGEGRWEKGGLGSLNGFAKKKKKEALPTNNVRWGPYRSDFLRKG